MSITDKIAKCKRIGALSVCLFVFISATADNIFTNIRNLFQKTASIVEVPAENRVEYEPVDLDSVRQALYQESRSINSKLIADNVLESGSFPGSTDSALHDSLRRSLSAMSGVFTADSVIRLARTFLGASYGYGATGPSRFDCSGYTRFIFRHFGIELERSSSGQRKDGYKVDMDSLRRGDLIIFGGRRNYRSPGHVGIIVNFYPETGEFSFIHASVHGVMEDMSTDPYYSRRIIEARRVLP